MSQSTRPPNRRQGDSPAGRASRCGHAVAVRAGRDPRKPRIAERTHGPRQPSPQHRIAERTTASTGPHHNTELPNEPRATTRPHQGGVRKQIESGSHRREWRKKPKDGPHNRERKAQSEKRRIATRISAFFTHPRPSDLAATIMIRPVRSEFAIGGRLVHVLECFLAAQGSIISSDHPQTPDPQQAIPPALIPPRNSDDIVRLHMVIRQFMSLGCLFRDRPGRSVGR